MSSILSYAEKEAWWADDLGECKEEVLSVVEELVELGFLEKGML